MLYNSIIIDEYEVLEEDQAQEDQEEVKLKIKQNLFYVSQLFS